MEHKSEPSVGKILDPKPNHTVSHYRDFAKWLRLQADKYEVAALRAEHMTLEQQKAIDDVAYLHGNPLYKQFREELFNKLVLESYGIPPEQKKKNP